MGVYVWPCPAYSRVSSPWGNRNHPISGGVKFHDGIDLAAASGTPILAAASGTVKMAGWNGGYGNYVSIDHGGGMVSFYGHCVALYVSAGATVKAGQKIAGVGTTGSSTGNHLHFGMHKNGQSVNPQSYIKPSDTAANYTGKGGASSTTNKVKALFTAYYPADNALEGGFLDAMGNKLDPSKRTCAAPASVPFGTKITVQDTGTSMDGVTYTVTDRGGAIIIRNGEYQFDLLMSSKAECDDWGRVNGSAIIGGDAEETSGESESKEITTVVVKSVTGVAGTRKEPLRQQGVYLQSGAEILIQSRNNIQCPVISGDIVWETQRFGAPASLKFTVIKDKNLSFHEGNPVSFRFNGENVFYGYVFSKRRTDKKFIEVTCYDQTRYLKNKDTLSYTDKTYAELLKMIAADYGLTIGAVADTKHKIAQRIEETTLFDMLGNAADLTLISAGKIYILYDDFGKLTLKSMEEMLLPIWLDADTTGDYSYTTSIDKDTYTRIKLAYDNDETGEREVHVLNETASQSEWGVLQHYEKIDNSLSGADLQTKLKALMKYYNVKRRELTMKKAFGDVRVRAGTAVAVAMDLGDIEISNYMMAETARHTFSHGEHTMELTLSGVRGEFRV